MAERVVGHGSFGVVFQVSLLCNPCLVSLNLSRFGVYDVCLILICCYAFASTGIVF